MTLRFVSLNHKPQRKSRRVTEQLCATGAAVKKHGQDGRATSCGKAAEFENNSALPGRPALRRRLRRPGQVVSRGFSAGFGHGVVVFHG
jgi:hypothetical protein